MSSTLRHAGNNWIIGTIGGFQVEAKAFTEPSQFGMPEDRRISKLWVHVPDGVTLYSYERGLDWNHLTDEVLAAIVETIGKAIR